MPVSIATARDPFRGPKPAVPVLRDNQAHLLRVLAPAPDTPVFDWPMFTRKVIRKRMGYSHTNSLNRLLNNDRVGLVSLGMVEAVVLDVDGLNETSYRITKKGLLCLSQHNANGGDKQDR